MYLEKALNLAYAHCVPSQYVSFHSKLEACFPFVKSSLLLTDEAPLAAYDTVRLLLREQTY